MTTHKKNSDSASGHTLSMDKLYNHLSGNGIKKRQKEDRHNPVAML
jgi:hypothetical protein